METIILLVLSFLVTSAQLQCHPETQFENNNVCCNKCGPGTKMVSFGLCETPNCEACADDEYQDSYTVEGKCKLQRYCDPNKNFQSLKSKTSRISCMCKVGFRCTNRLCSTCVHRKDCLPGHQATLTSDQSQKTVCENCPKKTFCSQSSWNNMCVNWTTCEDGFVEGKPGTPTTDRTCERDGRSRTIIIAVVMVLLVVLAIAAAVIYQKCQGSRGPQKSQVPADGDNHVVDMREDPEQAEDRHSLTSSGNLVAQEEGKTEQISTQESLLTT